MMQRGFFFTKILRNIILSYLCYYCEFFPSKYDILLPQLYQTRMWKSLRNDKTLKRTTALIYQTADRND